MKIKKSIYKEYKKHIVPILNFLCQIKKNVCFIDWSKEKNYKIGLISESIRDKIF